MSRIQLAGLKIDQSIFDLVQNEVTPGTGVDPETFWFNFAAIVQDLAPKNAELLRHRDFLQTEMDAYSQRHGLDGDQDQAKYQAFLQEIGYLVPEGPSFKVTTPNVDPEIATISGPQLVVPVDNARYVLNATNARWGSLFDAFYGTDVIPETAGAERGSSYNPKRGQLVFDKAFETLDLIAPLEGGNKYGDAAALQVSGSGRFQVKLNNGNVSELTQPSQFVGSRKDSNGRLSAVLLKHNNLHCEIQIDPASPIGSTHKTGVKDVLMEAALTAICDCEDSVAAADAADKTTVYRNWTRLMTGNLEASFSKGGKQVQRGLNPDRTYHTPSGEAFTLPGRSVLLVRNVGQHMYTDAVLTSAGHQVPEGFLDCMVTACAAKHDLAKSSGSRNSRTGSMYIVKPKQHGPAEVAATCELFGRVEQALGITSGTLKIGIMDEERRTSVNLKECIRAASDRVVFINTGFLDRTGDEIHTSFLSGPMLPKAEIKKQPWIKAYEDWNVDIALEVGLPGHGQIGKGMWAAPDAMATMMKEKIGHPTAGASTAWVPSPTAATLHAIHYHMCSVPEVQQKLSSRPRASLSALLTVPLLRRKLTAAEVQAELDNNCQGILGYVVRWVDMGVGCSKVPDVNNIGLMEDRATLRISSQHIANWLCHGLITEDQVLASMQKMALVVDGQNASDPKYVKLAENRIAFQAAVKLCFDGQYSPNGYTEFILHSKRRAAKVQNSLSGASKL